MKTSALLVIIGTVMIIMGVLWQFGIRPGKLPGDIVIDKGNMKFYFPITTSAIIILVIAIVFFGYRIITRT